MRMDKELIKIHNILIMQQNSSYCEESQEGKDEIPEELFALHDSDYQAFLNMSYGWDKDNLSRNSQKGIVQQGNNSDGCSDEHSKLPEEQRMVRIKRLERKLRRLKKQYAEQTQMSKLSEITSNKLSLQYPLHSQASYKPTTFQASRQTILNAKQANPPNNEKQSQNSTQAILKPYKMQNPRLQELSLKQQAPTWTYPRYLHKPTKLVNKSTLQSICTKFQQIQDYISPLNYNMKLQKPLTLQQISYSFDIHFHQICNLYTQWQKDHTFYDRIIREDLFKRTPQKRLTLERLQHVSRLIKENPFLTLNQLCIQLNKIQDLKSLKDGEREQITKTIVARLLQVGKFKKKRVRSVPKERNTAKQLQKRYQFCARYKQLLDKQAKIYFLDQSGFNLYMIREKAWSRPKEEITVNCPISKGKRFSLIAIIGQDGLAHWRIIDGNYRKYEYLDFIHELFERLYNAKEQQFRQKWLIMDNCSIHDKEETMKLADRWNVKVMYLPAYSPQLNPIQMWFHELKTKIRKINYAGERQLLEIMDRTLKDYEDYDFSNYYHGSLKFVEKGLRKEKF